MLCRTIRRLALPLGVVAVHACNVYTEDLLGEFDDSGEDGGTSTGGAAETGGSTGGSPLTGGAGSGGTSGSEGVGAAGGDSATGGAPTGGAPTGGAPTGGATASGGVSTGGAGGEAGISGAGAPTGGDNAGGAATGGAPTGGDNPGGATTGGAPTGGAPTGGAPTGGAPTGGAPTGGVGTGGLPPGFTAIDMLDVANSTIELSDGEGAWYTFHDESADGVIDPDTLRTTDDLIPVALPAERDGSLLGVHVVANDQFSSWGAGVGFNLNAPSETTRNKYDASPYSGVAFWGRAGSGTSTLRLKVVTADITPDDEPGGECTADCSDAFGYPIELTTTWQEYSVQFSELSQQGWGYSPPGGFDPTGVLAIQLHADSSVAFNIWLDDVRFFD